MALENNIEQSVAKNWSVLFQNFRKVVTWMKSGLDSPEALAMPEDYAITKLFKAAKTHDASVTTLNKQVALLAAQNIAQAVENKKIAQLLQQVDVLTTELQTLRTTLSEPAEPKPTKKAKAEPEVAQVVEPAPVAAPAPAVPVAQTPDEVQLTAAAVDAGELSEDALAQVSELLGSMEAL